MPAFALADSSNDDIAPSAATAVQVMISELGLRESATFDAMKPGAFFTTVGRGASTVTDDLVAALESGTITGEPMLSVVDIERGY